MGASAAAKVAYNAVAKSAVKSAAKKNIRKMAKRITEKNFKKSWKSFSLINAKNRLKNRFKEGTTADWLVGQSIDAAKGSATEHAKFVAAEAYVNSLLEGKIATLMEATEKQFNKNSEDNGEAFGKAIADTIDFTGIKTLVEAVNDDTSSTATETSAWLNVFSTFDPTGWLSAAANFAKPICSDQIAAVNDAANKGSSSGSGSGSGSSSKKGR